MNECDVAESDGARRRVQARYARPRACRQGPAGPASHNGSSACHPCDNLPMTTDGTPPGTAPPDAPAAEPAADLSPLTRRIVDLLVSRSVAHRLLRHPPVLTSEEASRVRGTPLE